MTESKLFVLWGQGGSIALQTLFLNDLQGKEGLPREHFGDSWSRQWTRWPPKSSQGKEAEKCSICCSSQYQGLKWTLGRGILSSIHAQKKRTEGWKEAGRQQKPLWAPREFAELGMLAVAPWEGPAPPQRLWQKQLPGNGGAQCSGAVPRPGWEVAAGNGWYKLNKLLRSLWRPMEQLYFSCAGGGSDNLQISYFVHIVYIYL